MEKISSRIKRLLEEKGIKQTELAARASIAQSSVSRYVNGLGEPKLRELHAISKALGVSMDSWFAGLPPPVVVDENGKQLPHVTNAERKLLKEIRAAIEKFNKNTKKNK